MSTSTGHSTLGKRGILFRMKQVLVIHGGNSFESYEEYLDSLRSFKIDIERSKGWKAELGEMLGPDYEVISPRMPNASNAKYQEWKIWFEKYISLMNDGMILVGHSLGGSFIAKYLCEETISKKVLGTYLVAASHTNSEHSLPEFSTESSLQGFEKQGGEIFLYHSTDDAIVPYSEFEKYRAALPHAVARSFTDRAHFLGEEFPELVEDIKSLK